MSREQVPEGYKQTEVGVIPEDWDVRAFGKLYADPSRNGIYKSPEYKGRGTRIVNMGEMFGFDFISDQEMSRISLTDRELTINSLHDGDLLFGRRSVVPSGAGKCSLVIAPPEPLTFESSIIRVRLNLSEANSLYYYYYFSSPLGRALMRGIISGTNVKGIRGTELRDLEIPWPEPYEQEAIASTLSDIDNLLASLDRLIAKKRDLKQATMQQLLTGKKRLPGFEEEKGYKKTEAGEIPKDWDVYTIGETVTLINGRAFKPSDWATSGLPIIRIQNLNDPTAAYNYYEKDVEERYHVNFGDVLFAWSGTKESSFGARMWRGQKAILNQHIFRVVPDEKRISPQYVLLALKKFQEEIEKKSHGFKSSFVHIKKSDLENTHLAVPSLAEQKSIAQVLTDMDTELTTLQTRRHKTQALKQAMMQELLTGKTRLITPTAQ